MMIHGVRVFGSLVSGFDVLKVRCLNVRAEVVSQVQK